MKPSMFLAASIALIGALPASGATLVNGAFDDGLNGYDLEACAFACDRDPTQFLSIGDNGGDSYLEVTTGTSLSGVIQASATQEIAIDQDTAILTFDAVYFGTVNDPGSLGGSPFEDALSVVLFDETTLDFSFLFDIGNSGFDANPFSNQSFTTTLTAPSDSFYGTGVEVDLTSFIGETLRFGVFAFIESDGTSLSGGFDNFTFSRAPALAPVPLPAGLPLILTGLAALGLLRRRRSNCC